MEATEKRRKQSKAPSLPPQGGKRKLKMKLQCKIDGISDRLAILAG
jgi:hypothetical protein